MPTLCAFTIENCKKITIKKRKNDFLISESLEVIKIVFRLIHRFKLMESGEVI
jgi:hypothetical protein